MLLIENVRNVNLKCKLTSTEFTKGSPNVIKYFNLISSENPLLHKLRTPI